MSWGWKGFFRDDPVFRFKEREFFQSGRHAAEERFWKLKIHDDGSYARRGNISSLDNFHTIKEALEKEEELEGRELEGGRLKRREGSVEEEIQSSHEDSDSSSDSSSSDESVIVSPHKKDKKKINKSAEKGSEEKSSSFESNEDDGKRKKRNKKKEKKVRKHPEDLDGERERYERMAYEERKEMERRQRMEDEERRQRMEEDRRRRESTPEYYSFAPRLRRMSEFSSKDYPYAPSSTNDSVYNYGARAGSERREIGEQGTAGRASGPRSANKTKHAEDYYDDTESISSRYY